MRKPKARVRGLSVLDLVHSREGLVVQLDGGIIRAEHRFGHHVAKNGLAVTHDVLGEHELVVLLEHVLVLGKEDVGIGVVDQSVSDELGVVLREDNGLVKHGDLSFIWDTGLIIWPVNLAKSNF